MLCFQLSTFAPDRQPKSPVETNIRLFYLELLFISVQYAIGWLLSGTFFILITMQELICRGWFLPPNAYDCGSFVVNGTAVVGKESKKPYNR